MISTRRRIHRLRFIVGGGYVSRKATAYLAENDMKWKGKYLSNTPSHRINGRHLLALRHRLRTPRPLPIPAGQHAKHLHGPDPDRDTVSPLPFPPTPIQATSPTTNPHHQATSPPNQTPSSPSHPSPPSPTPTSQPPASVCPGTAPQPGDIIHLRIVSHTLPHDPVVDRALDLVVDVNVVVVFCL